MSKATLLVCLTLCVFLGFGLITNASAQTPLAPGSIQVSRIQYDGNNGNNYASPFTFPEIFNDQTGCNVENDICNIAGIEASIYIDQFSAVPAAPVAGSLSLPSTGAPAPYPTVEPGSYITSSFSSKSEGALTLSPGGNYLTYMGYQGGDQLDDVSNSYSPNPSYQLVPNTYTDSNGNPYPFYDREVALIGNNGLVSLTPIDNADSGDNPRAAITIDGLELYTAGNSDSTEYTNNNVVTGPGLTIGVRCGTPLSSQSYQLGTYVATDRPDETAKKHIKDNNWRGLGIYNDANGNPQLYVAKGSGGNGDDGVFQVGASLPVCTAGGTDTNATITPLFSAPATNPTSGVVSPYVPFGFFFANPTTLYVADEGYQNLDGNGNLISDPLAGLEKWSLVNGTWTLDYTIQTGLNLYQAQNPAGYVDQNGAQIQSYPTGIRNMTGSVNGDGTVTVYAITAQYSSVSSGEPDPTSLVGITDSLAATTLPANEQFVTLQTAQSGEVFRGVAYVPLAAGTQRQAQTITFTNPGPVTYGVAPITLTATATSGWPIPYTLISGPATLAGNVVTITGAGSVVVQADQSGNTEYSAATSVQDTIVVNPEATSVTWPTPAPITYGTPLSGTQLNATGSVPGTLVYTPAAGTVLSAGLQTLTVAFTPTSNNYAPSTGSVQLLVNQATPTITWATPSPITYGTLLSATQLDATASVAGSFVYTPPAGTKLNAGTQTLSALFTPSDATDYTTPTASVNLTVNQATQTISFTTNAPSSAAYGTSFTVAASASSGLPITYTSAGVCTNSGATYTITSGTGTCTVTASQPGNGNYLAATPVSETTTAVRANPTVTFTGAPATAPLGSQFTVVATTNASGSAVVTVAGTVCSLSGQYSPDTATVLKDIGTCKFTATWGADANYNPATASQSTVATKITSVITWPTPAPITYGTTLSGTQLNATANAAGTFTYNPASGALENAGTDTLSVKFVPSDKTYTTVTATVTLQVKQAASTTTITSPKIIVAYEDKKGVATAFIDTNVVSFNPGGTVFVIASTGEVCSAAVKPATGNSECKLTFATTGSRTVTAKYSGDANHLGSNSTNQITVTVDPQ